MAIYCRIAGAVVAAMLHDDRKTITNDMVTVACAWRAGMDLTFLTRWEMQFMANCDLGLRWNKLAAGPTWFTITEGEEGVMTCQFPE